MLKIAIVGCGKIADDHAWSIAAAGGCRIVGVCDREPLMANQLAERFPVDRTFTDIGRMLDEVHPDVVHVTTPPQSHYSIAKQCLDFGSHVYVEKPFTTTVAQAEDLLRIAESRRLVLTVGHDRQFCHASRRMRALILNGYLGGPPVHMESYYGYDLGFGVYAKALLADQNHWVRKLPGQLLHNIISHSVARIAEHLQTDAPDIFAHGFVSPNLRQLGETEIVDELRVVITEAQRTTAYLTVSSQTRPLLNQFHAYGTKNGLSMDQQKQILIRHRGRAYPSYAEQFIPPLNLAKQYLSNLRFNFGLFLGRRFHQKQGMKFLTENFYKAVRGEAPPPIPYREILLTTRIMDSIFKQLDQIPSRARARPS
jgi:predicted dehydrogenase